MPTEDGTTIEQHSPSISAFPSCPPEETQAQPRAIPVPDPRDDTSQSTTTHEIEAPAPLATQTNTLGRRVVHTVVLPRPEPASESDASQQKEKPAPPSPDVASSDDSDAQLAQSLANTGLTIGRPNGGAYLSYSYKPPLPHSTSSFLFPGSKFRGTQQSDRQVYEVQVEIKNVDLIESTLCGYLRIQGLTDDHPTLTTFFEGEIIGPKYLFKTEHPTWNSSEKIDLQHWARFNAFRPYVQKAKNSSSYTIKNNLAKEHLFMRWKEYFLVPDHRVKSISGASFEGFYYICFDQRVGNVSGIYFHAKSEKYQQLELKHVHNGGCMGAVEFR